MYSIGEAARLTGISAYTLRYYEQIGLLHSPQRLGGKPDGVRQYDEQDVRFIQFIYGLKQTGMKLEDIAAFTEDGCLLSGNRLPHDIEDTLHKRIGMLDRHLARLDAQIKQLESVRKIAEEKRSMYDAMLLEQLQKNAQKD
ncbi:MerR family transcriptional regulator [Paenibacillus alvei]|uniref:MerR family transcriptional regulator n=1 Tax=Paenibacillus alvei TaxID=44250 RepID=A0ABT4GSC4_PAEAL|nr:MerR family transcriptional regulator [Paenibacillus alvei]EJW18642.1 putative HTH-type transcriptional regulator YyaN [Paenibacillus alvei DSM 29]MCY9539808.1 MerR family transcriptional regulator [Paenibacillus alvei]MCY9703329.1 MerR family transcriptional regulator [Paenibacillus alvei]MCY9735449.1 MerR family transcriptional regulator [Paenibacillus alvei]MCY9753069.1 MerR family transcriptional regulator [Paenibacillus alvei]